MGWTNPPATVTVGQVETASLWNTYVRDNTAFLHDAPYKARAYLNGGQALPASATTLVNLDTKSYDPNTNFSVSTHLYTAPVTGYYLVAWNLGAQVNNAIQDFGSQLFKNGSAIAFGSRLVNRNAGTGDSLQSPGTDIIALTAADTLGLYGLNSGGGNTIAITQSFAQTYLAITWVSS